MIVKFQPEAPCMSTCPRWVYRGVEFGHACWGGGLRHIPGITGQYRSGHYATFRVRGDDADLIRAALDAAQGSKARSRWDGPEDYAVSTDVLAAMDRIIAAHPDRYQADGDASGWMSESILGNAV